MAAPLSPYVEFHVDNDGRTWVLKHFGEACAMAVGFACSDGLPRFVDVVVIDEEGARAWGGDAAVETYREDPEASVFERIEIKATSHGRIA